MALKIPDNHKKHLAALAALADPQAQSLVNALRSASPEISPKALAKQIASAVDIPLADLASLLTVLISLTLTRVANRKSIEQIAADVTEAAVKNELGGLSSGSDATNAFQERLTLLFRSGGASLEVTARAAEIYFAHHTLFQAARVYSDIRPIFAADDVSKPIAGMIVHNLQLDIERNAERASEYLALNVHDLKELRSVIDRALEKDAALKDMIRSGGMSYMEDTPNPHQQ